MLYGAHAFWLHPFFVARAWWLLYGFPWDPRLWLAFFLHDIGYIGSANMDGEEGELHPLLGALLMSLFVDTICGLWDDPMRWYNFTLLHSRYYAKDRGKQPSQLCMADKLAIALTPAWLYLPMVRATGEIEEYMAHAKYRAQGNVNITEEERRRVTSRSEAEWYAGVQSYCARWAYEHRDGKVDTWTSSAKNRAQQKSDGSWV